MSGATASVFLKQLKELGLVVIGGSALFSGYNIYSGNEKFYRNVVMPSIKFLNPETTHNLALFVAKYKLVPKQKQPDPPCLCSKVLDHEFPNPVGLAAGFDKDGVAVDGMLKAGFGFVEVGSVTPKPQPGNPKPRLFRLWEDKGVINRFGFNSDGHDVVCDRLTQRLEKDNADQYVPYIAEERNMLNINMWTDTWGPDTTPLVCQNCSKGIVGINLGKNKTSPTPVGDYVEGVKRFGPIADYLVINVSSPNTPGLRNMQGRQQLEELVEKVSKERDKLSKKIPLLVKIAPDLSEDDKRDISEVVLGKTGRVDGLIVSNTTISRPDSLRSKHKQENGGLSGEPLKHMATQTVKDIYRLTKGQIPIIGVGGVSCGQDAYDKIRAGASLVQLYSAMVYQGPPVVSRIKRELEQLLIADGFTNVSQAVGADVKIAK